jgi:5-methylcytosine-specific restriction endonuclease McrA
MPERAKQRCSAPSCGVICVGRYCAAHIKDPKRPEATYDRWRGSAHSRGYNSRGRWGKLRKLIIARDPLCQLNFEGCTRISTLADHKTPKNAGGDDSMDNLQGVCSVCHGIKTRMIDPQRVAAYRIGRPGSQQEGHGDRGVFFPTG